jgi:hypothetical protein
MRAMSAPEANPRRGTVQVLAGRGEGLVTAPERMHRVHRVKVRTDPSGLWWRTFCKLGLKRRLVLMLEWLTWCPVWGVFPQ